MSLEHDSTKHSQPALLADRRGLILGVSGPDSVGYRCAATFRALGAEVALGCRRERRAVVAPLATELGGMVCDFEARDEESVHAAVDAAGASFGRLDFVLHTLVRVPDGVLTRSVLEASASEFEEALDVGVRSLLITARAAAPWFDRSAAARLVTLSSSGGELAIPNYHLVGIAKGALASALRYLALELGPRGVLCNSVCFSILDSEAARRVLGSEKVSQTRAYLAKRSMTGAPLAYEDVACAAAFLVSPLCRNMTAEVLTVDGGFTRSYF